MFLDPSLRTLREEKRLTQDGKTHYVIYMYNVAYSK